LCDSAIQILGRISQSYSTLEFDLVSGKRGSRVSHTEQLLIRLTGAESAFVVNNNAAAVMLVLTTLCYRKRVIISRTQLVEIGGGFRVPEVMRLSGAKLIEVGTTNRVHLSDYEDVFSSGPAHILHTHQSNFRIVGFFSEPTMQELAEIAIRNNALLIDDIGSGALIDTARYGLIHEPTVQESLSAGSDVVCFSGDKLLGGPQAGIIVGKKYLIDQIKKHPIARALRADKVCHAALSATLIHYLKGDFERNLPVWQMISKKEDEIMETANNWIRELNIGEVIRGCSTVGGGSIPGETIPTYLVSINDDYPDRFLGKLRRNPVPIIARIENDHVVFDPRTVLPDQEELLIKGIKSSLKSS
jgi:L-seryl-tRNA(Ser) seleniumtransferase